MPEVISAALKHPAACIYIFFFRSNRRLSVLDELSEESTQEENEDFASVKQSELIPRVDNKRILQRQSRLEDKCYLPVFEDSGLLSRSFESYLVSEKRTSIPRQISDPVTTATRSRTPSTPSVCRGTLSPFMATKSSRCRPLMISPSGSHHDSNTSISDGQSTIINSSSLSLNISSSKAKDTMTKSDSVDDTYPHDLQGSSISLSSASITSLEPEAVSCSSQTFITASQASYRTCYSASQSSTLNSSQCSYQSCFSSPDQSQSTQQQIIWL